jgi:hypothetical protein
VTDLQIGAIGVLCVLALGGYFWLCSRVRR